MAWQVKDEWLDLAQGKHVVIYHNPEILVDAGGPKPVPQEHHLIHQFNMDACPHCGHVKEREKHMRALAGGGHEEVPAIDFHQVKADTLDALHKHHQTLMGYRGQHPNVPLRSGPKS